MSMKLPDLNRRKILKTGGYALLSLPALQLSGCGGGSTANELLDLSGDSNATESTSAAASSWATGGTRAMTAEYVNPFTEELGNLCYVTESTTEGPCYSGTEAREDISEGRDGLPVRLCFKVVDTLCNPIEGALVDIWHCDVYGVYSGSDMAAVDFCTGGDPDYYSENVFRGTQVTDSNGLVYFSTCFPGWYQSRAIHIHLIISKSGHSLTSQVGFDDDLVNSICRNEPLYLSRGLPDTSNSTDTVFPASNYEIFLMQTEQQPDNSMLAWKTLVVDL